MKLPACCLLTMLLVPCTQSQAQQWTQTIDCPAGREYRDDRGHKGGGGGEFCVLQLPGSLWVKDGPARWWFSFGNFGEEGLYQMGRKTGLWNECDRFNTCAEQTHQLLHPEESASKPEIPVSFVNGKYVFDFASCWSTWITQQTEDSFLELNIGSGSGNCYVTHISPWRQGDSQENYFCEIPQTLGIREFDVLDLRQEFTRLGLPQFCRQDAVSEPGTTVGTPEL